MPPRIEPDADEEAPTPGFDSGSRWSATQEALDADESTEGTAYRRRRAPVPVRRNRWREALALWRTWRRTLLVALAVIATVWAGALLFRSSWFVLGGSDQIELQGAHQVQAAQVDAIFGADFGRNVFFIPLRQRRAAIENIDWVRQATVMRLWPARLQVRLQERTPVAFVRTDAGLRLIDADGVLLSPPAAGNYDFPVLTGLAATGAAANAPAALALRRPQVRQFLALRDDLDRGGEDRLRDFSEINLGDPDDVQVTVAPEGGAPPTLIHFGNEQFYERYQLYLAHIAEWRRSYPDLTWVELQFEGQAIVDTGTGTPPAAAPAAPAAAAHARSKPAGRRGH